MLACPEMGGFDHDAPSAAQMENGWFETLRSIAAARVAPGLTPGRGEISSAESEVIDTGPTQAAMHNVRGESVLSWTPDASDGIDVAQTKHLGGVLPCSALFDASSRTQEHGRKASRRPWRNEPRIDGNRSGKAWQDGRQTGKTRRASRESSRRPRASSYQESGQCAAACGRMPGLQRRRSSPR